MNKKGQKAISGGMVILIIAVIAIAYFAMNKAPAPTNNGGSQQQTGSGYISTGATALTYAGVDALNPGTTVTGTTKTSVDGAGFTSGITSASPGNKLEVVLNSSGYHSAHIASYVVPSSPTATIPVQYNANASITMTLFNTNSVVMTNGGGATNQTVAAGGAYNMKLRMDGQDKKSTQDMRCILETTVGSNVSNVVMSGFGAVAKGQSKPNWYTLQGTGSAVYVYDINAVTGAVSPEGTVSITSASSKTISGSKIYITCYTKEWFVDQYTGKAVFDVEDSLGNLQSIASYQTVGAFS